MINEKSVKAVREAQWSSHFCTPLYKTYSFSKIPGTLLHLLGEKAETLPKDCWTGDTYQSVIVFLIDGLGWKYLEKFHDRYPFLKRFYQEGIVSLLTSQFPSTTAAHITSLCSGMEVGQTGIYEWFYYEPLIDRVIAPLLFSYAGDKKSETLKGNLHPEDIFPSSSIFEKISSHVFQADSIAHSSYSNWMFRHAQSHPFKDFSSCLTTVLSLLDKGGLFYVYLGDIDALAHRHGFESEKVLKILDRCFQLLEQFWMKVPKKVACILTADHGMTSISPKTTIYLNKAFPSLEKMLKKGKDGKPLTPAGSCRDYFLHVEDDTVDEAKEFLQKELQGNADIYKTSVLMREGFFGSKSPSETFLKRVGNLVILPYENQSVWWFEKGRFQQKFCAMHGGLSRDEMEIGFLFLPKS